MNKSSDSSRHITVLCDRYWPASDDNTLHVREFVGAMLRGEAAVSLMAPMWSTSWPERYQLGKLSVQYASPPPTSAFRYRKFSSSVGDFLSTVLPTTDAVYCDRPGLMAETALHLVGKRRKAGEVVPPVWVRYREAVDGDRAPPAGKALGVLRAADQVLVTSAAEHRLVLSVGIMENKIFCLGPVGSRVDRSQVARSAARRTLYEANYELTVKSTDSLMLCVCDFAVEGDTRAVVDSVKRVLEQHRNLRLWLVGKGNARSDVYEALRYEGLHRIVVMPGVFISLAEALQAADLVIVPPSGEGRFWVLPTCLRSGIPVVYPDRDEMLRLVDASHLGSREPGTSNQEATKTGIAKTDVSIGAYSANSRSAKSSGLEAAIQNWLSKRNEFSDAATQIARRFPSPQVPDMQALTARKS